MAKDLNADRFVTKRWPYGTTPLIYYIRPGGSDNNDGLTVPTAFATLDWGLHHMSIAEVNQAVVLDITGMTISGNSVLNLGGTTLGGMNFDLDLAATSPNNFFSRRHRQIRSDLTLVTALAVTGQAFNATTGLLTLTVSNALVANALRGRFAVGAGLGEYGVIRSNTGGAGPNTIEVANLFGLTLPVNVYAPGATITYGDAGNGFEQAIYLQALCDWSFQGITFASHGKATAIGIWPNAPVVFTLCDIAGMALEEGGGVVTLDGCYVHNATFAQNGCAVAANQSGFRSLSFICRGSGAAGNAWIGVFLDACSAFGGGSTISRYNFELTNAGIDAGTGYGIEALFATNKVQNVLIANCASSAIHITNPSSMTLNVVAGTGNVGYGLLADYGSNVQIIASTTVTGTLNDLFVGLVGAATWANTPITDLDRLVRVGS